MAVNPKTGLTSILALIYTKYYDLNHKDYFGNASNYIFLCKHYVVPFKPVILMIRDPIERFMSAMVQVDVSDVDDCVESLIHGKRIEYKGKMRKVKEDPHFGLQHELIFGETHLFKFKEHYSDILHLLNIKSPMVHLNKAKNEKPKLNQDHIDALESYYAEDMKLFRTLTTPNTIVYS